MFPRYGIHTPLILCSTEMEYNENMSKIIHDGTDDSETSDLDTDFQEGQYPRSIRALLV